MAKQGKQMKQVTKQHKQKQVIRGTIAELLEQGFTVNGKLADQPTMSVLSRFGIGKEVGKVPAKSETGRGKAATVWEFKDRGHMSFGLDPQSAEAVRASVATGDGASGAAQAESAARALIQKLKEQHEAMQDQINALESSIEERSAAEA